jgi:hypothetical protein
VTVWRMHTEDPTPARTNTPYRRLGAPGGVPVKMMRWVQIVVICAEVEQCSLIRTEGVR